MKNRVAKNDGRKVDLLKPVKEKPSSDDCFGNLWDLTAQECKLCADCTVCGIVYDRKISESLARQGLGEGSKQITKGIRVKLLNHILRNTVEYSQGAISNIGIDEVIAFLEEKTGIVDEDILIPFIKAFIRSTPNIYTKGGKFWKR